jgi:uncharacterized protein
MRIIRYNELQLTAWKNGGGVTREIAVVRAGDALVWRLSIADVERDGPFSSFEGLRRILTVTAGDGMELTSHVAKLDADYGMPVHFDGGLEIQARLKHGPVQDLNLIYNPSICTAGVFVMRAATTHSVDIRPGRTTVLHCMAGFLELGEKQFLHRGDTALVGGDAVHCRTADESAAVVISIQTEANS